MRTQTLAFSAVLFTATCLALTPPASALSLAGVTDVCYELSIGNADIPAFPDGFFYPGCEPFLPPYISLTPIDPTLPQDCTIPGTHEPGQLFAPDPVMAGPSTVQIELVQLSLRSVEPILVAGDNDSLWDVFVTLTPLPGTGGNGDAFPPGQFTVDSFFDIEYRISFVNTDDGSSAPGGDVIGNLRLAAPPMPWFHTPTATATCSSPGTTATCPSRSPSPSQAPTADCPSVAPRPCPCHHFSPAI